MNPYKVMVLVSGLLEVTKAQWQCSHDQYSCLSKRATEKNQKALQTGSEYAVHEKYTSAV